jgi:hypothetical protein
LTSNQSKTRAGLEESFTDLTSCFNNSGSNTTPQLTLEKQLLSSHKATISQLYLGLFPSDDDKEPGELNAP